MSNSPVVNVRLEGMDDRKSAIFRMAFKMHAGTRYEIMVDGSEPDIVIVDVDSVDGLKVYEKAKADFKGKPVLLSSVNEPEFQCQYLAKPIRVEVLFPVIRAAMQGGAVFNPDLKKVEEERALQAKREKLKNKDFQQNAEFAVHKFKRKEQLPTTSIQVFDPDKGLLGTLRKVIAQDREMVIIFDNKPLMIVYPDIQKILLAVGPQVLQKLCDKEDLTLATKPIPNNPAWRNNAKVSFESCLWQFAVWSCKGRLVKGITPDSMLRLKGWPNLTRLAHIQDSMRLSAFMTQTTANLHILYKIMKVELIDLLNFIAATYLIGLLLTDASSIKKYSEQFAQEDKEREQVEETEDGISIRSKYKAQSTGMLQRLMSRMTAVKE